MKLAIEDLKDICESYGIFGENRETLIEEFFREYAGTELVEHEHDNAVFDRSLYYYHGDRVVLCFSTGIHTLYGEEKFDIPGYAELFGKNKDFVHRFYDNGTDELLRKGQKKSEDTIAVAGEGKKSAPTEKATHKKLADFVRNIFAPHQNG